VPSVDFHRAALDALDSGDQAGFRSALESDIAQGMDLLIRNTTTVGRERTAGKDQT
jgi:DNA-binding GntR family transcriptional regulator